MIKRKIRSLVFSSMTILAISATPASVMAGPVDVAVDPSPQEFSNTCQSYSMALAMSFHPASPYKADTPAELRELERRLRGSLVSSAQSHQRTEPIRDDWKAAVEAESNGKLSVAWKSFPHLDPAMNFVASKTGVANAGALGASFAIGMVKTPVMLSFTRIAASQYTPSHIVTAFGIQLPIASMSDSAKPKLLLVNSAVKYAGGVKNICANEDLSDKDKYRAVAVLTDDYDIKLFDGLSYLVTYIVAK